MISIIFKKNPDRLGVIRIFIVFIRRDAIDSKQYCIIMRKRNYQSPEVVQAVSVWLETGFLGASIVDVTSVEIDGQQTDGFYNMDNSTTFNHTWE